MPDVLEPITHCLKCGGEVWDNRKDKKNPKSPDFKCKDKDGCGEGYWLAKGAKAAPARTKPVIAQSYDAEEAHVSQEVSRIQAAAERGVGVARQVIVGSYPVLTWEQLQTNMAECVKFSIDLFEELQMDVDPRAVAQVADTLFIERQKRGI